MDDPSAFQVLKERIEYTAGIQSEFQTMSQNRSETSTNKLKWEAYKMADTYLDADEYLRNATQKLRIDLESSFLKERGRNVTREDVEVVEIDRVHWKNLSMRLFMKKYAGASRPVVITGLPISKRPWTLQHIKRVCGNKTAMLKKRVANSTSWGGLENAEILKIGEFIDSFRDNGKWNDLGMFR